MAEVQNKEFYDLDAIKARLAEKLGSDQWENIRKTDMGQAILAVGANIVHLDAMAFFAGLNQMFLDTADMPGYVEALAKNVNIVPQTYQSAQIILSFSVPETRSYEPLELMVKVGDHQFWNIEAIDFTAGVSRAVAFYEGTVVREASQAMTAAQISKGYSYDQIAAPVARMVGNQVIQKYQIIPRATELRSIRVLTRSAPGSSTATWTQYESFFGLTEYDRAFVVEKDFLGRYRIVFGDGTLGSEYPTDYIVSVEYLVTNGADVVIDDFTDIKMYSQGVTEITDFTLDDEGVSPLIEGKSVIDIADLKLQIKSQQATFDRLVRVADYETYLDSRTDVIASIVQAERHADPPNEEMFNVLTFACKPPTAESGVNVAAIKNHASKYGLQTVDFQYIPYEVEKFNITVDAGALSGYPIPSLLSSIQSLLEEEYGWSSLGFGEKITPQLVLTKIMGVEGLDLSNFEISVDAVYTDTYNGATSFDAVSGVPTGDEIHEITLPFVPQRYQTRLFSATEFSGVPGHEAMDDGNGNILGDFSGDETFTAMESRNTTVVTGGNLMFIAQEDENNGLVRVVNLNNDSGAVSSFTLENGSSSAVRPQAFTWDDVNRILTVLSDDGSDDGTGTYLRTYKFTRNQLDPNHPYFIQKQTGLVLEPEDTLQLSAATLPTSVRRSTIVAYHDGFVYVVWERGATSNLTPQLCRYAMNSDGGLHNGPDPMFDANYGTSGFVNLWSGAVTTETYRCGMIVPSQYMDQDTGEYPNVMWLGRNGGLDELKEVDETPVLVTDFDSNINSVEAMCYGEYKSLYLVSLDSEGNGFDNIIKVQGISDLGTGHTIQRLTNDTQSGFSGVGFGALTEGYVFYFDKTDVTLNKHSSTQIESASTVRAGQAGVAGTDNSIYLAASVDYEAATITFDADVADVSIVYKPLNDLTYSGVQLAVLNTLSVVEKD